MKKNILRNESGVSPVLGFVLILAIGVTLITNMQINSVPIWNLQEDLDHLEMMTADLNDLKSKIDSSFTNSAALSSSLSMGFKYSPKGIFYNPRENAVVTFSIKNDTWAEIRYNELMTEGLDDSTRIKNLSRVSMTYALQGTATINPFFYENGVIWRSGYTRNNQNIAMNGRLNLQSVTSMDQTIREIGKRTINIYPTSPQKNTVIGKNVYLILHTEYSDWWATRIKENGGRIRINDSTKKIVIASFDQIPIYMAETQINVLSQTSPESQTPFRLVQIPLQTAYLPIIGSTSLIVEVQDKYNNPVPNIRVNFSINSSKKPLNAYSTAVLEQNYAISGTDGRASIMLKTSGTGVYYIEASTNGVSLPLTYTALSTSASMSLNYNETAINSFNILANLKDSDGNPLSSKNITFESGAGLITPDYGLTDINGNTSSILSTTTSTGIKISNIQTSGVNNITANITWKTIDPIKVGAWVYLMGTIKAYILNTVDIITRVNSNGCVYYGTTPGNYPNKKCDTITTDSHSVALPILSPYTAYYFIVNSSRPGGVSINSTEYMFVTDGPKDTVPPSSITNLNATASTPFSINWTWTDPADIDFDHVQVYIDDTFVKNVNKGVQYYNASYFKPFSTHKITIRTVDVTDNVDPGVNQSANTMFSLSYVFSFLSMNGTVSDFNNSRNGSDGGLFATLTERNRTKNPAKTIIIGKQSGVYNSSSLDTIDGSMDVTIPINRQIKTVVYYMGQRENVTDMEVGTNFTGPPVSVFLPENDVTVRDAWFELKQLSGPQNPASVTTLNMYLNGVDYSVINTGTYQSNTGGESLLTVARANVTSAFSTFANPTNFTAGVKVGNAKSNIQALRLFITYEYDSTSPKQLKTIRYPLDTKSLAINKNTETPFTYRVSVPETVNVSVRSSWFEIRGVADPSSTTDAIIKAKIEPNTSFSTGANLDMQKQDNYEFLYLFKTTPEFSLNTLQTLTVRNEQQAVYTLGGEVVVTYEYSVTEPIQVKTVKYFVGQQAVGGDQSLLSNSTTVFIPEQGIKIKSVWARVRATFAKNKPKTETVSGNIAGVSTTSRGYDVNVVAGFLIGDHTVIYNMTGAAQSLVNNTVVFVNTSFNENNHGPPGTELYVTYEYDSASPREQKTVEYLAGQSPAEALTRNDGFTIVVPEMGTLRRSAYIDYTVMSSSTADFTTTSAIDTVFSTQSVTIATIADPVAAGVLNGDDGERITASSKAYSINYSSGSAASFSGVARLTYEFNKTFSANVTYTFTEIIPSSIWQSISIKDNSYGDTLANIGIFNVTGGVWESILKSSFSGGSTPSEHVNITKGGNNNASNYDAGGQIKIRYNWAGSVTSNNLGIDLLNVTIFFMGSPSITIQTNTTNILDALTKTLQLRYNVSGDTFKLQIWNGSANAWNNRTTLNATNVSTLEVPLLAGEFISTGTLTGEAGSITQGYVLVRYVNENPSTTQQGKLFLDYQRVYSHEE